MDICIIESLSVHPKLTQHCKSTKFWHKNNKKREVSRKHEIFESNWIKAHIYSEGKEAKINDRTLCPLLWGMEYLLTTQPCRARLTQWPWVTICRLLSVIFRSPSLVFWIKHVTEQDPVKFSQSRPLSMSSTCLLSVDKPQRINLIREVRKCRMKTVRQDKIIIL